MSSDALTVACTVCFGAADGALLTSARLGVMVMAGVTVAVLTTVGVFFVRLARRQANTPLVNDAERRRA